MQKRIEIYLVFILGADRDHDNDGYVDRVDYTPLTH